MHNYSKPGKHNDFGKKAEKISLFHISFINEGNYDII
jgi:hypothetical protein